MTITSPNAEQERQAIARMLYAEADSFTLGAENSEAEKDERNCYAARAVAANLRRLAAWVEQGEHYNY